MFCWAVEKSSNGILEISILKAGDHHVSCVRWSGNRHMRLFSSGKLYLPLKNILALDLFAYFSELVASHHDAYIEATSRHEKIHVSQRVVVAVYDLQGRFLKYEDDLQGWVEVSERAARTKVCQAFHYRRRHEEQMAAAPP